MELPEDPLCGSAGQRWDTSSSGCRRDVDLRLDPSSRSARPRAVPTLACSILQAHKQEEQDLPDRVGSGLVGLLDEAGTSLERLKKVLLLTLT